MSEIQALDEAFTNHNAHPAAEKAAIRLVESGVPEVGVEAAMAYANPFPDKPIMPFVVPGGTKNVVPTAVRNQVTVSKPATLTAGSNWGLAIIEHPIIKFGASDVAVNYTVPGVYPTGVVASTPLGSLFSAFAFDDTATDIDLVGQTATGGLTAAVPIGFDTAKIPGTPVVKLTGQAVEVENTTPPLYSGGSVTMAKFDMKREDTSLVLSGVDSQNVAWLSGWPYRFTDVAANPSAVSWLATKGLYMPNACRADHALKYNYNQFKSFFGSRTVPAVAQQPVRRIEGGVIDTGMMCKVAIFRGLQPQATLLLNTIVYLSAAQDSNSALFPISRNEPPKDESYEKLIMEMSDPMPVATIFKGNALGSWFNDVCDVVSSIGESVGSILPGPFGMVASGLGKAAKFAGGLNRGAQASRAEPDYGDKYDITGIVECYEEGLDDLREYPPEVRKEVLRTVRLRRDGRMTGSNGGSSVRYGALATINPGDTMSMVSQSGGNLVFRRNGPPHDAAKKAAALKKKANKQQKRGMKKLPPPLVMDLPQYVPNAKGAGPKRPAPAKFSAAKSAVPKFGKKGK